MIVRPVVMVVFILMMVMLIVMLMAMASVVMTGLVCFRIKHKVHFIVHRG